MDGIFREIYWMKNNKIKKKIITVWSIFMVDKGSNEDVYVQCLFESILILW